MVKKGFLCYDLRLHLFERVSEESSLLRPQTSILPLFSTAAEHADKKKNFLRRHTILRINTTRIQSGAKGFCERQNRHS